MRLILVLSVLLFGSLPLMAASVMKLDGTRLNGEALSFIEKGQAVRIGDQTVPLVDCDWIEPGDGAGLPDNTNKRPGVWLVDGSWLPVSVLKSGDKAHTLLLTTPLGELTVPLTAVRGWGSASELIGQASGEDQVLLESGLLSGRVEGLIDGKLIFKSPLDPDKPLSLDFEQVRGTRISGPDKAPKGLRFAANLDDVHAPLRLVPSKDGLALMAVPTVTIDASLLRLRVEGGRRTFLSDLNPTLREETGAFGVVWPYQRGRNLDGSPLRLGGVRYDHGLVIHSKAKLGWDLDGAYTQLRATVGIADIVGNQGDCEVSILVDGKEVWGRPSVRGGEQPQVLDINLTGAKRLEVQVNYGARYDIGDHFVLADAFLIKAK